MGEKLIPGAGLLLQGNVTEKRTENRCARAVSQGSADWHIHCFQGKRGTLVE